MRADELTYRRATSTSLLGLALQGGLAAALALYAVFARDAAGATAAILVAVGLVVWLGLALVFHQHALERVEAIEQEALASAGGATESSVFERAGADLRPAADRLAWMHRVVLPLLSLLVGAALIGVGIVRFLSARRSMGPDEFAAPSLPGWAIAVGLGSAALGFIFARFVAGMAKQPAWANLRAGAASGAGAAVLGLVLAVAHFAVYLGNESILRYATVGLPLLMVALGAEVFFNFLLNIYRPRRKGETPRPAFESRLLGYLAAPDRLAESFGQAISYQFGFDVTGSWFYRLLSRAVAPLIVFGASALWGLSALAVIKPNEKGLILRFGALQREVDSGLHFKWPWPAERLERFPALAVNAIDVATPRATVDGPLLWTTQHLKEGDETFALVQPPGWSGGAPSGDLAVVAVECPLHYTVNSLEKYERLAPPAMRAPMLRAVAARTLLETLSARSVDDVLGAKREEINAELRRKVQEAFDRLDAGVTTLFVGVAGAHPPQDDDVAQTFERVIAAEQSKQAAIERARGEAIRTRTRIAGSEGLSREILGAIDELEGLKARDAEGEEAKAAERRLTDLVARAGGEAKDLIVSARASRWDRHMREYSRAVRHAGRTEAYRAAPGVYRAQLYLDALAEMMADARVYITAFPETTTRWNLEDVQDIGAVPTAVKPKED